jgi:uncharacterized protein YndB with AHSA1/START domain
MITSEASIEVGRPAVQVFDYVTDLGHAAAWLQDCVELALVDPAAGWSRGSKLRYVHKQGGQAGRMEGAVAAWEPGRRLEMEFADGHFAVTIRFGFESLAAGTRVTHSVAIDTKGLMGKVMGPLIRAGNERQVRANLLRLKSQVEAASSAA